MSGLNIDKKYAKEVLKNEGKEGAILSSCNPKIKKLYLKYNALLMSYLYYRNNELEFDGSILTNSKKNHVKKGVDEIIDGISPKRCGKIKDSLGIYKKKRINKSYISFPLFAMNKYLEENLDDFKDKNEKQLIFARKFGLDHLQNVKNIAEVLGFNDILNWQTINLSTDIFHQLLNDYKAIKKEKNLGEDKINWNQFLLTFSITNKIENYENLRLGLKSLGVNKINPVKIQTNMIMKILDYVKSKYGLPDLYNSKLTNLYIGEDQVQEIYLEFEDNLNGRKNQLLSNIRGLLRAFGYKVIIQKINSDLKFRNSSGF